MLLGPYRSGSWSHWQPLRNRKMIAFSIFRQLATFRPVGFLGQNSKRIGSIRRHNSSEISQIVPSGLRRGSRRTMAQSPVVVPGSGHCLLQAPSCKRCSAGFRIVTKARYPFALFGYCLMTNHFHLLLKPAPGQSISRILQSLTVAHTWRHHRREGTSGHVWQGRFRSPVIQDGDHVLVVLRYIEANPVRAAIVADPCEYTWSSHRCHGAGHADPILDSFPEWEQLGRTEPERRARWRRKVRGKQPAKELDGVRSSVRSGRPYGAEDWVEVISHRLGIVREPRRRGRPPREKML